MKNWVSMAVITLFAGLPAMATTISSSSAPWLVDGNPAVVLTSIPGSYFAPFSDGQWIGVNSTGVVAPGSYTFTLDIGSWVGSSGSFSLTYGADNSVSWSITNGSLGGTLGCLNPSGNCFGPAASPITVPAVLTGTFAADSVLTATVVNDGGTPNPMALFVAGTADTPEPSTFGLMLGALGVLGLVARKRAGELRG